MNTYCRECKPQLHTNLFFFFLPPSVCLLWIFVSRTSFSLIFGKQYLSKFLKESGHEWRINIFHFKSLVEDLLSLQRTYCKAVFNPLPSPLWIRVEASKCESTEACKDCLVALEEGFSNHVQAVLICLRVLERQRPVSAPPWCGQVLGKSNSNSATFTSPPLLFSTVLFNLDLHSL